MLEIINVTAGYGEITVLHEVSLKVERGQIVSIIGANGAGKTTLLNTISGLVKQKKGSIRFMGEAVPPKPHEAVRRGIVQVPEGHRVFAGLTILENLVMGGFHLSKQEFEINLQKVYALFPLLQERKTQYAGTLSGGEQQMLAVGRGLMSNPKVMLFDEPSLGLAPLIVNEIMAIIRKIRAAGITVLLVEQNARKALNLSDYAYVLENGKITVEGPGRMLLDDAKVRRAYLGEKNLLQ